MQYFKAGDIETISKCHRNVNMLFIPGIVKKVVLQEQKLSRGQKNGNVLTKTFANGGLWEIFRENNSA